MTTALHHIPHRTKTCPPARRHRRPRRLRQTTLLEMLCKAMRDDYDPIAITNDIYTKEDQRLLTVSGALPPSASWAWKPAAAPTRHPRGLLHQPRAIDRMLGEFPNADIVFVGKRRRQPGRHLQPRAERPHHLRHRRGGMKNPRKGAAQASPKRPVRHQQDRPGPHVAPTWM